VSGITCPAGWQLHSTACYFFSTATATFAAARTACQAMNLDPLITDIVSISDQAAHDFIVGQMCVCIDLLSLV